jgi:hypothetical protein
MRRASGGGRFDPLMPDDSDDDTMDYDSSDERKAIAATRTPVSVPLTMKDLMRSPAPDDDDKLPFAKATFMMAMPKSGSCLANNMTDDMIHGAFYPSGSSATKRASIFGALRSSGKPREDLIASIMPKLEIAWSGDDMYERRCEKYRVTVEFINKVSSPCGQYILVRRHRDVLFQAGFIVSPSMPLLILTDYIATVFTQEDVCAFMSDDTLPPGFNMNAYLTRSTKMVSRRAIKSREAVEKEKAAAIALTSAGAVAPPKKRVKKDALSKSGPALGPVPNPGPAPVPPVSNYPIIVTPVFTSPMRGKRTVDDDDKPAEGEEIITLTKAQSDHNSLVLRKTETEAAEFMDLFHKEQIKYEDLLKTNGGMLTAHEDLIDELIELKTKIEESQAALKSWEAKYNEMSNGRDEDMTNMEEAMDKLEKEYEAKALVETSVIPQAPPVMTSVSFKVPVKLTVQKGPIMAINKMSNGAMRTMYWKPEPVDGTKENLKAAYKIVSSARIRGEDPKLTCHEAHSALNHWGCSHVRPFIARDGNCGRCGLVPGMLTGEHTDQSGCKYAKTDCSFCGDLMLGRRGSSMIPANRDFQYHNSDMCAWKHFQTFLNFSFPDHPVQPLSNFSNSAFLESQLAELMKSDDDLN